MDLGENFQCDSCGLMFALNIAFGSHLARWDWINNIMYGQWFCTHTHTKTLISTH